MISSAPVMPGCDPPSHRAGSDAGVAVLHGVVGNPWSMRGVADAMIAAGFDVELSRLPCRGTIIDDLRPTGWRDWSGEVRRAVDELVARADTAAALGQSVGGTLALAAGPERGDPAGPACGNPATRTHAPGRWR